MVTISLCMIVKNEEKVLARCLDSLSGLMDEIIIVDTGSLDRTKEIASHYTDKIFDFKWTDDFSAARNFAFSKATQEYIYSADADELLTSDNREKFALLKDKLLPEIDIVQMKYGNQLEFGAVYNYDEEYRPKLFRRLRTFVWEESIHETVRLEPVIFDSDIVITHKPHESHAQRDFAAFRKQISEGRYLSKRLHNMYVRELFIAGSDEDFILAYDFFKESAMDTQRSADEINEACLAAAHAARVLKDMTGFMKYTTKLVACGGCSEICCELGIFYEAEGDFDEAVIWYYNAVYETEPVVKKLAGDIEPLEGLVRCYRALGMNEQAEEYFAKLSAIK
ncbi:MAG: glycosyltransferase [Lachnospiraceae bacterium]|nr:glycosyltransferase [Lachnospiraceae bacterium]